MTSCATRSRDDEHARTLALCRGVPRRRRPDRLDGRWRVLQARHLDARGRRDGGRTAVAALTAEQARARSAFELLTWARARRSAHPPARRISDDLPPEGTAACDGGTYRSAREPDEAPDGHSPLRNGLNRTTLTATAARPPTTPDDARQPNPADRPATILPADHAHTGCLLGADNCATLSAWEEFGLDAVRLLLSDGPPRESDLQ